MEEASGRGCARGWVLDPHLFDYNLDHYGVGTIDSPQWRIADREASYRTRAVAARGSLWGVHGYEAVYAHTLSDAGGERLNGAHSYVLRFEGPPPVGAGWSLAVYDLAGQRIGQALVGRGPVYGEEDGSPAVRIGRVWPDAAESADANRLSAPDGDFRLVLRLCAPGAGMLDGTYAIPAVERTR